MDQCLIKAGSYYKLLKGFLLHRFSLISFLECLFIVAGFNKKLVSDPVAQVQC